LCVRIAVLGRQRKPLDRRGIVVRNAQAGSVKQAKGEFCSRMTLTRFLRELPHGLGEMSLLCGGFSVLEPRVGSQRQAKQQARKKGAP